MQSYKQVVFEEWISRYFPIRIMCKHLRFWCYVHNALQLYAGLCLSVCGEAELNTDDLRAVVSWPRAHSWRVPSQTPPADWPPPLRSCHGVCCLLVTSGSLQGEVSDRQRHEDEDRNQQKTPSWTSQYGFFNNFYIRCPQVLNICLHPYCILLTEWSWTMIVEFKYIQALCLTHDGVLLSFCGWIKQDFWWLSNPQI